MLDKIAFGPLDWTLGAIKCNEVGASKDGEQSSRKCGHKINFWSTDGEWYQHRPVRVNLVHQHRGTLLRRKLKGGSITSKKASFKHLYVCELLVDEHPEDHHNVEPTPVHSLHCARVVSHSDPMPQTHWTALTTTNSLQSAQVVSPGAWAGMGLSTWAVKRGNILN